MDIVDIVHSEDGEGMDIDHEPEHEHNKRHLYLRLLLEVVDKC